MTMVLQRQNTVCYGVYVCSRNNVVSPSVRGTGARAGPLPRLPSYAHILHNLADDVGVGTWFV